MKEDQSVTGGCLCREILYRVVGESRGSGYCHCQSCRSHTGAPVVAFAVFSVEQVQWLSGERSRYESSQGVFRSFCNHCGASLTLEQGELIEFHISSLDSPNDYPPNEHTHFIDKIGWIDLDDNLPRYIGSIE